ncbi:MAG TPA: SRPBCC family protein [Actinomycetota bacterium]|nr:SRPBCC family protein [Actinomycetota bacterium]
MIDRSDSVTINRPVEEVFAYVTDTSNDPAWHTDILEAQKTSEGPIGIGTRWHLRFKPFMGTSDGNTEVVAFEPNRKEALSGAMGPMQPTLTYLFEPADGGTRFTRRVQIKVSGMMRLMEPFMQWVDAPKRNRRFVANLKRVLEQQAPRQ